MGRITIAGLSAACLAALRFGFGVLAAAVWPYLFDLLERSPRLAMMGLLALFLSPWPAASLAHRVAHRWLDRLERAHAPRVRSSTWAGALAWLVLFGADLLTVFVMLVIDPPEPGEARSALLSTITRAAFALDPLVIAGHVAWLAIATIFFALHAHARASGDPVRD